MSSLAPVYIQKKSIIHDLDFWTKLICFLILLPLAGFVANFQLNLVILMFFIALLYLSKIGMKRFWDYSKKYLIPISVALIVLSLLFNPGLPSIRLTTRFELSLRFTILISFGMLFSMVTNPIEIPAGFLRAKIPHKYGVTLMVGYRMMPLLIEKMTSIVAAQKSRGASFRFSAKNPKKIFFQISSLIVPLLHSTLEMSVRLSDALISRGYNPEGKITVPKKKLSYYDVGLIAVSIVVLIIGAT